MGNDWSDFKDALHKVHSGEVNIGTVEVPRCQNCHQTEVIIVMDKEYYELTFKHLVDTLNRWPEFQKELRELHSAIRAQQKLVN